MHIEDFVLKLFFAPIVPFVGHPGLIAAVAACWAVAATLSTVGRKKLFWPPLIACVSWGLFAVWEQHCVNMKYDIRVDLFLITPLLVTITLWGIVELARPGITSRPVRMHFRLRTLLIAITLLALAMGTVVWLAR